ncbi:unnamed protein product [Phytomonas sp. EM1]|nr:unnamed protein product [Phytomonas sp. EM1]|eukprot:CCW60533.1 unnamed protein product [Phytomonas sp. isolate EM1]
MNAIFYPEKSIGGGSLLFQVTLFCTLAWSVVWFLLTFSFLIFKASILPFPLAALTMEIVSTFLVLVVELLSVITGIRGNLTECRTTIVVSNILLFVGGIGAFYYMWLQTYVMMLDLAFSAILLGVDALTFLSGFWALHNTFRRQAGWAFMPYHREIDKKKQ